MEEKALLIENIANNGSMKDVIKMTSYVSKHEDEFEIENRIVNLSHVTITKNEKEKLNIIMDILDKNVKYFYYIFVVKNKLDKVQYFVNVHEGLNGDGDFVAEDMTNVYTSMIKIKTVTKWISLTDVSVDIVDDVSTWGVVFTL